MERTLLKQSIKKRPMLLVADNGRLQQVLLKSDLTFGRATETTRPGLVAQHSYVSRAHGRFGRDDYGYYYIDTSSKNGTYCNSRKLAPGQKRYLKNGDVMQVFNGTANSEKDFVAIVFVTDYPDNFVPCRIDLDWSVAEIDIGRAGGRSIMMSDRSVSANHASFYIADGRWAVMDHNSTNGVFLNGKLIDSPRWLRIGDCVRISNVHFFFLGNAILYQDTQSQGGVSNPMGMNSGEVAYSGSTGNSGALYQNVPLSISIVERSVWQHAKKLMLLQNINMTINTGEMVLILGGSGSGKTTFMNAVMGYEKAEGRIYHGQTDVYENYDAVKYKIGFVPQQDLLRGSDTVYDTLENAAEMKLPKEVLKNCKSQRIEAVLESLGLQRERDSLVSKLSGGQRKRLSIAVEYIADPSLFFLDEPDSGLDGVMAKSLMNNLRAIANEGKIVMVISHGPDRAAELFDKVIVLAKSVKDNCGHLAFFGTVQEAYGFFDADSLEGVVKRVNRVDEGGDGLSDYYIEKYNRLIN